MSTLLELKTATIGGRNCEEHIDTQEYLNIAGEYVFEFLSPTVSEIIRSKNTLMERMRDG